MMTINHTPRYLILFVAIALLAVMFAVTGGAASAQDSSLPDEFISAVQEIALALGGFLRPGDSLPGLLPAPGALDRIADGLGGYLIYFGNRDDISLDRLYTISVASTFARPRIIVVTYHDSAMLAHYAYHFGYDLATFAQDLGLASAQDQVNQVPVGTIVAENPPGASSLAFRPVPGDIGAYLIVVDSFDDNAQGDFTISITG